MGRFRITSLFVDYKYKDDGFALYTVKDEDHTYKGKIYKSLKSAYLELEDPTEYSFALKYFYNWKHWLAISNSTSLGPMIQEWRDELEVRIKSKAVRKMIETSNTDTKEAVAAAKWVSDRGWDKRKAGAPSKVERVRQSKIAAAVSSEIDDAYDRVYGTTAIN